LLDRLRGSLKGRLESAGKAAARVIPSPTTWTIIGLFFAFLAFVFYGRVHPVIGGLMVVIAGLFDVIDGAVARATGKVSSRGAFLDSTLDRVSELVIYLGILVGGYVSPFIVLLVLSFSLLVSYTRAKGDALGVSLAGIGVGERSERLLVLILASLLSAFGLVFLRIGILVILALAFITFIQRTVKVYGALGPAAQKAAASPPAAS